jgi:hypothetical protein
MMADTAPKKRGRKKKVVETTTPPAELHSEHTEGHESTDDFEHN